MTTPTPAPTVVGRLAPSPTGGLHLGHARTFLIAWWMARKANGRILLRIEDLDSSRTRPESIQGMIDDLRWLGLDWDDGPDHPVARARYRQSDRLGFYREALERLIAADRLYPCTCTRADIARAASAPHAEDEGPRYPGTCAGRRSSDALALTDHNFAWRFRVPAGPLSWDDLFAGPRTIDPSRVGGDFPVARSQTGPAYQLAVVVDDALMGVNQVIRGDDLIASTPRQILLYHALGWEPPAFGHLPLAVTETGRRLAKRNQSIKLSTLRERGLDVRHLVGWLAQACGLAHERVPSHPSDWIERFDRNHVPREPWIVRDADIDRLDE